MQSEWNRWSTATKCRLVCTFDPINYIFVFAPTQLDNDIAVASATPTVLEQVVEFSILLTGEIYSDNLDDPSSLQFQTLRRQLAEKVCLSSLSQPLYLLLCLLSLSLTHTHTHTHAHAHSSSPTLYKSDTSPVFQYGS